MRRVPAPGSNVTVLASLCPVALAGVLLLAATGAAAAQAGVTRLIDFSTHDGHPMRGKLTVPDTSRRRPVVVYVQTAEGSTMDTRRRLRDSVTFSYYDLYRQQLVPMDVGFMSYEGRGITGGPNPPRYESIDWPVYNTSTLENKVRDLLAAIEVARRQPGVDPERVILMGASEGTLLVAEAASRQPAGVVGLVMYGVLAQNMRETFAYILTDGAFLPHRRYLDTDNDGRITRAEWEADPRGYRRGALGNAAFERFDVNRDSSVTVEDIAIQTGALRKALADTNFAVLDLWAKTSAAVSTPAHWFRDHFAHGDLRTFLARVTVPVGLFHGDMDVNTPVSGVRALEAWARTQGRQSLEFHYFPDLDHSLGLGRYFVRGGELPAGHQAIFAFIRRLSTS